MTTVPSPTMTLLNQFQDRAAARKARDREYQRKRRTLKRMAKAAASTTLCRSCGRPLPSASFRQLLPGETAVRSEPCCPYCQNMMWRTQLWWMVKTQRFKMPEEGTFSV